MALVADDRCLVAGQTDQTENGIYVVDTGTWSRAPDFDSNRDIAEGTQVRVTDGSNAGVYVLTTSNPITLDTSNIVFANESSLVAGALLAANNFSDLASPIAGWDALARYTGSVAAAAGTLDLSTATAPLLLWTAGATSTVTLAQNKVRLARTSAEISVTCSSTLIVNGSTAGVHKIPTDTLVMFIGDAASVVRLFTMSAAWSKGADVASAGTVVLRPNALHHITGTTTITDVDFLPAADGAQAWVIFDGALTLTHNAVSLILPGGRDIIAQAGDRALFVQDSSDNVICLDYIRASNLQETWFAAEEGIPPTLNGAQAAVRYMATNLQPLYTFNFDTATVEILWFKWVPPARWDRGTVTFAPVWTCNGGTPAQTMIFDLCGVAFSNDDPTDAAIGTVQTSSDVMLAVGDLHVGPTSSAITVAGTPADGDVVWLRLRRDITDTLSVDAELLGFKLYWTQDSSNDA